MNIAEAFESAQFLVNRKGRRTAVVLDIQAWEALVSWIDDMVGARMSEQALQELEATGGRPQEAGWLDWNEIREEWGDEEEARAEAS